MLCEVVDIDVPVRLAAEDGEEAILHGVVMVDGGSSIYLLSTRLNGSTQVEPFYLGECGGLIRDKLVQGLREEFEHLSHASSDV